LEPLPLIKLPLQFRTTPEEVIFRIARVLQLVSASEALSVLFPVRLSPQEHGVEPPQLAAKTANGANKSDRKATDIKRISSCFREKLGEISITLYI